MTKTNLLSCFLSVLSVSAFATGVSDGLVFDLGFLNPRTDGTAATAADIANLARWSADNRGASAAVSTFNPTRNHNEGYPTKDSECTDVPTPLTVTNMTGVVPFNKFQTFAADCLYFHQPTNFAQTGEAVVFGEYVQTDSVTTGPDATVYLRFRWDGQLGFQGTHYLVQNGNHATQAGNLAWSVALYTGSDRTTSQSSVQFSVGGATLTTGIPVVRGEWTDLAISFKADGNGGTDCLVYKIGRADTSTSQTVPSVLNQRLAGVISTTAGVGKLTIGSRYDCPNAYYAFRWNPTSWGVQVFGFRGALARFRVFDRALSKEEIMALMLDAPGCEFALGSVNADGSEFAADGDSGIAETFEPRTMPVRRLRGRLSSEHPSISLKFPLAPESSGQPRILSLRPLFETPSGSAKVRVTVNGEFDWDAALADGQDCDIMLSKKLMIPDAAGNVLVNLTLLPTSTTAVKFDALRLTGGWQAGSADGLSSDWCLKAETDLYLSGLLPNYLASYGGYLNSLYPRTLYGLRSDLGANYYPFITVGFDAPASVASGEESAYVIGCAASVADYTQLDVYLNGSFYKRFSPPIAAGDALKVPFPAGTLTPGFNTLCISNSGSAFNPGAGSGSYNTFSFDYHRYEIKNRNWPKGLMVILR